MRNLLLIGLALTTCVSCSKTGEDSFSLKGRDAKLTGTWTVKTYESSSTNTTTLRTTNSVNSSVTLVTYGTNISYTQTDSTWSRTVVQVDEENSSFKMQNDNQDAYVSVTRVKDFDETTTTGGVSSMRISLYDDNTYSVTNIDYIGSSYSFAGTGSYTNTDGTTSTYEEYNGRSDTSYTYTTSGTTTSVGTWFWEEGSGSKLFLNAGPLTGQVIKLSGDELVLETKFGQMESGNSEGDDLSENSVDESETEGSFDTYSNASIGTYDNGIQKTVTTVTSSETTGQMIFTKIDKTSSRPVESVVVE